MARSVTAASPAAINTVVDSSAGNRRQIGNQK
jgi:hypothetical protein